MLKIKQEVNYRRGGISRSCSGCDHFVKKHACIGIGGATLGSRPRCTVIGLKPGRVYEVSPMGLCDKYDNEQGLRRLLGERAYKQYIERSADHETA